MTKTNEIIGQMTITGGTVAKNKAVITLSGLAYENRAAQALEAAKDGVLKAITLKREPENEHDAYAIHVYGYTKAGNRRLDLGYIPRTWSRDLAAILDAKTYITVEKLSAWPCATRSGKKTAIAKLTLTWSK